MKKIIGFILIFTFLFVPVTASASTLEVNDIFYDAQSDEITVSGKIYSERGNIPVGMNVKSENGKVIVVLQCNSQSSANGVSEFVFESFKMPANALSGTYTVSVSAYFFDGATQKTFNFKGADLLFDVLKTIQKDGIEKEDFSKIEDSIKNKSDTLNIDSSIYTSLNTAENTLFKNLMLSESYEVPQDFYTDENKEIIKREIAEFVTNYILFADISQFEGVSDITSLNEWLTNYKDKYALNVDKAETAFNESKLYEYVEHEKEDSHFMTVISQNKGKESISDIQKLLFEASLLSIIKTENQSYLKTADSDFGEFFGYNKANFSSLSATEQGTVYAGIAGQQFSSLSDATLYFDSLVNGIISSNNTSVPTGGGGGGGGGFVKVTKSEETEEATTEPETENTVSVHKFNDLANTPWAEEAINYLYEKGVISGRNEYEFCPDETISRAELIKMLTLVTHTSLDNNSEAVFSDVSQNDWFYSYVNAAAKAGIAKGGTDGKFNPNSPVTREDTAVFVDRITNVESVAAVSPCFSDWNEISDYAKPSVFRLYKKGVINGISGTVYSPKSNLTRAQAAVMLYRIVK